MFSNLVKGQRIWLRHVATGSTIVSTVVDVGALGSWVEIAGRVTLYSDSFEGWEIV